MEQLDLSAKPIIEILLDPGLRASLIVALQAEQGRHRPVYHQYEELALHCEATADQLRQVIPILRELDHAAGHTLIAPLLFHPNLPDDLLLKLCEEERFISPLGHRRGPQWLLEKLAKEYRYSEAITTLALSYYGTEHYSNEDFKAFISKYKDDGMLRWNLKRSKQLSQDKQAIALSIIEQPWTNRDLYLFVRGIKEWYGQVHNRTLESYLSALWRVVSRRPPDSPTIEDFVGWVRVAFNSEPTPFDPQWLDIRPDYSHDPATYDDCMTRLLFQVADLHRMREAGVFENEYRYFGITSPGGSLWYNFDPLSYLECAVRGKYGGYEAAEVIVTIPPPEGESADSPIFEIDSFTWQDFADLLELGQLYE